MCHLLLKHGACKISCFNMRIKMIAAQISKLVNVFDVMILFSVMIWSPICNSSKYFLKGCLPGSFPFAYVLVNIGDGRDRCWRAL